MKRTCLTLIAGMMLIANVFAQSTNPDSARIVTSDIGNFWQAYDGLKPGATYEERLRGFFNEYYLKASPGLKDFIGRKIGSVFSLVETIDKHPRYYDSLREHSRRAASLEDEIRKTFYAMDSLYEDSVFPDVYFLIGRMTSAGTVSEKLIMIGTEMFGMYPDTPSKELNNWHKQVLKPVESIPLVVAHELVHYQQKYPKGARTLLSASIQEGSADFIAKLLVGGHTNEHIQAWADPREKELWREFTQRMHGSDFSGWLYDGDKAKDRPADLGYWMGYKIAEASYEQAKDKHVAIKRLLEINDFDAFLVASGYGEKFSE